MTDRPLPDGAPVPADAAGPANAIGAANGRAAGGPLPYSGVRVLDLTRVIAGPIGTRFLAAYGADVLRIDPPGFAEVPALLPETTAGKRTAALDLRAADEPGGVRVPRRRRRRPGLRAAGGRAGRDSATTTTRWPRLTRR